MKGRVPERPEAKNFKEADVKTKIKMIRQVCVLVLLEGTFGIEFSEEELNGMEIRGGHCKIGGGEA